MILSLDVRRARKGDCLLLHYGTAADPGLIVIDGGPAHVYEPHLKPRLEAIRSARNLSSSQALPIDLLMVSHVDDDHINGILQLTRELTDAANEQRPPPWKVRSVWHNTFDDLIGNDAEELTAAVTAAFGVASLGDLGAVDDVDHDVDHDVAKVLASVAQGFRLRDDARRLKLRINPQFDGKLVMAAEDADAIDLGRGLTLRIAGPMRPELIALQKKHDEFLEKKGARTRAALAAFTDRSVANLSSIVALAQADGKSILLTGDARGDKVLEGLELVGLLEPGGKLHVDVLKMPHHGSDRNMTQGFLKRVTADHYVFSGNGEHGNPERSTLDMLRRARGKASYAVHLTYPIDEIDQAREEDWQREQRRERRKRKKNPSVVVRDDWSHAEHSLDAFFDKHPSMAKRVRIADETRHVIDLLDPLSPG